MNGFSCRIASSIAGSLLLVVGFAQGAAASVIYGYTGNPFTNVGGAYTTSDFVTIDLVLSAPLPANLSDPNGTAWLPLLESFSFSDGVQTLSSQGGSTLLNNLIFSTDADSLPTLWNLRADTNGNAPFILSSHTLGDMADIAQTLNESAFVMGSPGPWTLTPEPSTALLLAAGLTALAVRRGSARVPTD